MDGTSVTQIDTGTNRPGQTIESGSNRALGHRGRRRLGLGPRRAAEGLVWRFEPGPSPIARSIEVGAGWGFIAFGEGAVWVANYLDGTVTRIDPRTNRLTSQTPIGPVQALAVGEGAAWVSVAGAPRDGTLPASACSAIESGGGTPDLVVGLRPPAPGSRQRLSARDARGDPPRVPRARVPGRPVPGRLAVLRRLDRAERRVGATPVRGQRERYGRAKALVAVIGPYNSAVRPVRARDPQPRPGRAGADGQSREQHPGLTRGADATAGRLPGGARGLLPDRDAQLLPADRPRDAAGRRAGDDRAAASGSTACTCSRTTRLRSRPCPAPRCRSVPARGAAAAGRDRRGERYKGAARSFDALPRGSSAPTPTAS